MGESSPNGVAASTSLATLFSPSRSSAMRTIRVVQTFIVDQKVVEDLAPQNRLGHDPRHVFDLHAAVPDSLGVDDDRRAMFALLEAAGVVGTRQRAKSRVPE